jgi:L-alanine-DL-glutamate epimerase-like enolase superfamily enzyme
MQTSSAIASIKVATLQAALPVPVVFGNWVMRHREFAVCGVVAEDGTVGLSYCYTRDGPVREIVDRLVAPHYVDGDPSSADELFDATRWSNNAILASGVGHRALSLVDVATWDLSAKLHARPSCTRRRSRSTSAALPADTSRRRSSDTPRACRSQTSRRRWVG